MGHVESASALAKILISSGKQEDKVKAFELLELGIQHNDLISKIDYGYYSMAQNANDGDYRYDYEISLMSDIFKKDPHIQNWFMIA